MRASRQSIIAKVPCQVCGAEAGKPCGTKFGPNGEYFMKRETVHLSRMQDFQRLMNPKLEIRQRRRWGRKAWEEGAKAREGETKKNSPKKSPEIPQKKVVNFIDPKEFYESWPWKEARYAALKRHGRTCQCCGWRPGIDGRQNYLVVDHIRPLSKFPELAFEPENLQVLCNECNMGKSHKHYDDFRFPGGP